MTHAITNTAATGFLIGLLGSCHLRVEAVLFLSIGRRTARWCVVSSVGARLDPAKWCGIEFCVRVASLSRMSLLPMSQRPKARVSFRCLNGADMPFLSSEKRLWLY